MVLSLKQKVDIDAELLRNGGKIGKAAADLELPYTEVLDYVSGSLRIASVTSRPELQKYIIASKDVNALWPKNSAIEQAHYDYDKGYIELCQWREGNTLHLLAIRRKQQDRTRRKYFSRAFEEPCSRGCRE